MTIHDNIVLIWPRRGTSAREIAEFLEEKFQQPGMRDDWRDPNPLINAHIRVLEDGS